MTLYKKQVAEIEVGIVPSPEDKKELIWYDEDYYYLYVRNKNDKNVVLAERYIRLGVDEIKEIFVKKEERGNNYGKNL